MNSIISNYAVEQKDQTTGEPSGKFFLSKKGAKAIVNEVGGTYFNKNQGHLDQRFDHAWKEVDPLGQGYIAAQKGPVFLRSLTDSVEISNDLQLQVGEEGAITNENEYRPLNGVVAPWSVKPASAATTKITGAYHPGLNWGADREYSRVVPSNFAAKCNEDTCDKDDKLMHSIISKYALEQKIDGKPSGNFFLSKDGMRSISSEVVGTHFGFKGKKKEKYLESKFPALWAQADVNKDGFLAAMQGPPFLRSLLDSVELSNKLQLQLGEE